MSQSADSSTRGDMQCMGATRAEMAERSQRKHFLRFCFWVSLSVWLWLGVHLLFPPTPTALCLQLAGFACLMIGTLTVRVKRLLSKPFAVFFGAWFFALVFGSVSLAALHVSFDQNPVSLESLFEPWVCKPNESCDQLILLEFLTLFARAFGLLMWLVFTMVVLYAKLWGLAMGGACVCAFIVGLFQLFHGLRNARRPRQQAR